VKPLNQTQKSAYNGAIKIVRWIKKQDLSLERFFLKIDKDNSGSIDSQELLAFVTKNKGINIHPF